MNSPAPSPVPTALQLARALAALEPADALRAAAHLATPRNVLVGRDAVVDEGWFHWRDQTVFVGALSWTELAQLVVGAVAAAAQPGDVFLDLDDAPRSWLKLVRSGARVHLAGSAELFSGPTVLFDTQVSADVARAVATMVARGDRLVTGTMHVCGRPVRVRADARAAFVGMP